MAPPRPANWRGFYGQTRQAPAKRRFGKAAEYAASLRTGIGGLKCPCQKHFAFMISIWEFFLHDIKIGQIRRPCLSIRSAHTHPPLARGGRVVCLLCSPSQSVSTSVTVQDQLFRRLTLAWDHRYRLSPDLGGCKEHGLSDLRFFLYRTIRR